MSLQLEAFLGRWRAFLQPKHALLFSQLNGAPLTVQGVYKVFQTSAFRISGKKTNPHLVRDMVVTHLRCPWLARPQQAALLVFCTAETVLSSPSHLRCLLLALSLLAALVVSSTVAPVYCALH